MTNVTVSVPIGPLRAADQAIGLVVALNFAAGFAIARVSGSYLSPNVIFPVPLNGSGVSAGAGVGVGVTVGDGDAAASGPEPLESSKNPVTPSAMRAITRTPAMSGRVRPLDAGGFTIASTAG